MQVGRYTLLQRIGSGGFASVWLARDQAGAEVAVKILHRRHAGPPAARGPSNAERFLEEARILRSLAVPGVVRVLDVIDEGPQGNIAYVMEKLEGRVLLEAVPELPLAALLGIFAGVAETLAQLHALRIVHRDVKLTNIFLCGDFPLRTGELPSVKLIDFGIAKDLAASQAIGETATGRFVGTVRTMAPELFDRVAGDDVTVSGAVDQWGLGVALFQALAGVLPFDDASMVRLIVKVKREPVPPLSPAVPAGVEAIVRRCLEKDPARRFPSARELAQALRAAAADAHREAVAIAAVTNFDAAGETLPETRIMEGEPRAHHVSIAALIAAVLAGMAIAFSLGLWIGNCQG